MGSDKGAHGAKFAGSEHRTCLVPAGGGGGWREKGRGGGARRGEAGRVEGRDGSGARSSFLSQRRGGGCGWVGGGAEGPPPSAS
jgi:hypothetical protein